MPSCSPRRSFSVGVADEWVCALLEIPRVQHKRSVDKSQSKGVAVTDHHGDRRLHKGVVLAGYGGFRVQSAVSNVHVSKNHESILGVPFTRIFSFFGYIGRPAFVETPLRKHKTLVGLMQVEA